MGFSVNILNLKVGRERGCLFGAVFCVHTRRELLLFRLHFTWVNASYKNAPYKIPRPFYIITCLLDISKFNHLFPSQLV